MMYTMERRIANDPRMEWTRSSDYPYEYTYGQAEKIVGYKRSYTTYRMVPVITPAPKLRQVTREEFLETLVDEAKERLSFDNIHKYLPFQSHYASGRTHDHLVSDHVYPIQTEKRIVREGETLCGRARGPRLESDRTGSDCPGCIAIARGLAVRDLV